MMTEDSQYFSMEEMMSCAAAPGLYLRISALFAYSALLAVSTLPIPFSDALDTSAMSPDNI
jgi:hypothetical protein